jgi:hypothetical protein
MISPQLVQPLLPLAAALSRGTERCYGAGDEEMATSSLHLTDGGAAMPQPNDLSRSLVALDQNSTIIAVVELSHGSSHRANHMSQPRMPAPTGIPTRHILAVGHANFTLP